MNKPSSAEGSGQHPPDESHSDEPLKFSTGKAPVEQDTVLQFPKQAAEVPTSPPESYATQPEPENSASSYTNSEVRFRLFPRESGHPVDAPLPDATGILLGHFRIKDRIGTGGMGAVFRAVDERLQRVVALKVLSPTQLHQPDSIQRFRNEARSAAMLDHDNIARVFYVGEEKGVHFIANEFVIGENIRDMIQQQGRLKVADAVNYTIQVAMALNHTSAAGVIHRDIKPSNIIVTPAGRAKLVDLGLARKESTESTDDLTEAGTTLGTFDYIAPEQAKDPRFVDVRSDIYSLGCSLYHMLTGEPPYAGGSALQKLLEHQASATPDPADKVSSIPPQLSHVVKKMMASNIDERYSSPYQIISDLNEIAPLIGMQETTLRSSSRPRSNQSARWESYIGWVLASVLLIALVIGLDVFSNTQSSNSFTPTRVESGLSPEKTTSPEPVPEEKEPSGQVTEREVTEDEANEIAEKPVAANSDSKPDIPTPPEQIEPNDPKRNILKPFVVLGADEDTKDVGFRRLSDACNAASQGSIIEIQGAESQQFLIENLIQVKDKSITLRAKSGHRPQIHFSITPDENASSPANISLSQAASLKLYNIDIRFIINSNQTTPTLFALLGEQNELLLKNCSVTVLQEKEGTDLTAESKPMVAANLFKVQPARSFSENPSIGFSSGASKVEISDSFLRGNARLISLDSSMPATIDVSDSVIAMNDSIVFLTNDKQQRRLSQFALSIDNTVRMQELSFKQSTILIGAGPFINRTSKPNAFVETYPFQVTAADCIFATQDSKTAFVNLRMVQGEFDQLDWDVELARQFRWQGSRNYYDQFQTYLEIGAFQSLTQSVQAVKRLEYEEWNDLWNKIPGRRSSSMEVDDIWQRDWRGKSLDALQLSDLKLHGAGDDPANPSAKPEDLEARQDVGAPIQQLIELKMLLDSSKPVESEPAELSK